MSVCYKLSRFLIELFLQRDTNTLPTTVTTASTVGVSTTTLLKNTQLCTNRQFMMSLLIPLVLFSVYMPGISVCYKLSRFLIDFAYNFYRNPRSSLHILYINTACDFYRSPLIAQERTFHLTLLGLYSPLVKKCFGCEHLLKFKSGSELLIPVEPHDLVITSVMRRPWYVNGQRRSQLSNVYFHCNERCVKIALMRVFPKAIVLTTMFHFHVKRTYASIRGLVVRTITSGKTRISAIAQPAFLPFLVVIPPDTRLRLKPIHYQHIRSQLGLVLS